MKRKITLTIILLILLIQSIFIVVSNKKMNSNEESVKIIKKDKNIEEIFSKIDEIEKIKNMKYSKINNKWIGEFEFEGLKAETEKLINSIEDFQINSYYIVYEEGNIYIQGVLEHK